VKEATKQKVGGKEQLARCVDCCQGDRMPQQNHEISRSNRSQSLEPSVVRQRYHKPWVLQRIRRAMLGAAVCCVALTQYGVSAFSVDQGVGRPSIPRRRISSDTDSHSHRIRSSYLCMTSVPNGGDSDSKDKGKKKKRVFNIDESKGTSGPSRMEMEFQGRITKLEAMVAKQEIEIQQLKQQCMQLAEAAYAFGRVVNLLREAGLETPESPVLEEESKQNDRQRKIQASSKEFSKPPKLKDSENATVEYFDDSEIFGRAPSSVIDAADAAGAAILAGMLGGKQRMLVDVRDAELSRDPETLVQFIELAILPVAAGLEGLKSTRNRVKIVFPTVSQLLEYRRTMALAAPEVVALSTLGFDPVERMDNIVVIVAPSPDDEEGLLAMNELLNPTDPAKKPIDQPLVVLNYHMVPVQGIAARFEVAYHLRLLSVQFMTGNNAPENFQKWEEEKMQRQGGDAPISSDVLYGPDGEVLPLSSDSAESEAEEVPDEEEDAALEAAMKHAHELGVNQGVTRAMVIRAYPR